MASDMEAPRGKAIIVAGMHRSGTSAMARVLSLSGGDMAQRVIAAADDNPHGYWEPQEMVALNNEVLAEMGSAWDDPFAYRLDLRKHSAEFVAFLERARTFVRTNYADAALPIAKDPRTSLIAPLWIEAFDSEGFDTCFVIMVRSPLEVAESISKRDGAQIPASILAWLSNMMAVERDTRGMRRIFVSYGDLIDDWASVVERVGQCLDVDLTAAADDITAFVSADARHHKRTDNEWTSRPDVWPGAVEAWEWFSSAARGSSRHDPFPDHIEQAFQAICLQMAPVLARETDRSNAASRTFRSLIADKDATVLRLQAQVREYAVAHEQAVAASVSQAQTAEIAVRDADESACQAKDLAAKLALSLETRRTAEHKIMKLAADLKAADEALTRALEQAEAWRRQCEQDSALLKTTALEASTLRQERDTLHVTASENQTRIRELEAGAAELRSQMSQRQMQLDALRATLEAMKSTRAWRFADAIRRLSRPSST